MKWKNHEGMKLGKQRKCKLMKLGNYEIGNWQRHTTPVASCGWSGGKLSLWTDLHPNVHVYPNLTERKTPFQKRKKKKNQSSISE